MEVEPLHSGFVAIIGAPNVGKSTLLNAVLGTKLAIVTPKPQTTRHRLLGVKNLPGAQMVFLDTPGIHTPRTRLNRYMMQAVAEALMDPQVVLYVTDASHVPHPDMATLRRYLDNRSVPVFWVLNKIDRLEPHQLLPVIGDYPERDSFAEVIPVSALQGTNVSLLIDTIVRYLPEGPRYFPEDMPTDRDERFLMAELIREQVMLRTHQEVPYAVAAQVDELHERPDGSLEVDATILVEKASQKRILVGHHGQMIKSIGMHARQTMSGVLHCPVHLRLFVKVKKDWREHEATLRDLGFGER